MKERGILFSAPMVRAILAGTKTQTRRLVKWPLYSKSDGAKRRIFLKTDVEEINALLKVVSRHPCKNGFCPYGVPGDRLWVRETWARDSEDGALFYRADVGTGSDADDWQRNIDDGASGYRWRPSIHMPRWASRITLEITGVRVERLADISDADAQAEGCTGSPFGLLADHALFPTLWDSINGPGSWDANPWVWVIEFRRV